MSKNEAARRSFSLIATRKHGRMDVLNVDGGGETVLPLFSFREEGELFLGLRAREANWRPRETTGELVSLLLGLCAGVDKVALDPLSGLGEGEILGLVSTGRRHFVRHLIGEDAAPSERENPPGRVTGCSDPARLRKAQKRGPRDLWRATENLSTVAEGGREVMRTSELLGTKMVLATNGSEEADVATRAAVELAEGTGSELYVVYVEPLPDFMKKDDAGTPGYDRALYEQIEAEARERLWKLVWRVKVAGGTVVEAHLRMGGVAEEIVAFADELEADLIVVGSRGLGRIRRTIAGSVSESVFRHARCPVMVVRPKGTPPSRRGGGRPRARRVFPLEVR